MAERDLWTRWKEHGDHEAREKLAIRHMRVVKYVAGRMAIHVPASVSMDDLIGWGVLGLLDAIDKYDPGQNTKFSTYATIRIRGAVLDQIRSLDWAPRSLRAMARKVATARQSLRHVHGRDPSYEEIGDEIGVTPEQVEKAMSQLQTAQVLSLDSYLPSEDADDWSVGDYSGIHAPDTPADAAVSEERRQRLAEAILKLPEQQQTVLHLYYFEELTLKEIGAVLEVSESRVCQVHGAAVRNLRKVMEGGL